MIHVSAHALTTRLHSPTVSNIVLVLFTLHIIQYLYLVVQFTSVHSTLLVQLLGSKVYFFHSLSPVFLLSASRSDTLLFVIHTNMPN